MNFKNISSHQLNFEYSASHFYVLIVFHFQNTYPVEKKCMNSIITTKKTLHNNYTRKKKKNYEKQ